jgi:hypothetical protein
VSVSAVKWAEKQKLPANHALLLRTLAWTINGRGNGWLCQEQMAARSNQISLSTVKRALRDLRRIGILDHRWALEMGRKRKCYTLDLRRTVIWDSKDCSWREQVRRLEAQFADAQSRPGESRQEFVDRQMARLARTWS